MDFPRPSPSTRSPSGVLKRPSASDRTSSPSSPKQRDILTPNSDQAALPEPEERADSSSDELAQDTALTSHVVVRGKGSEDDGPLRKRRRFATRDIATGEMSNEPKTAPSQGRVIPQDARSDDPVANAYMPLSPSELEDSESWVDFESNETLFNGILEKFGIVGLEVNNILSCKPDEAFAQMTHTELYGIIACVPSFAMEGDPTNVLNPDQHKLWFAKQHWGLACGTIALLHILMNQDQAYIGDMLSDFKRGTAGKDKYAKGVMLDQHRGIRAIHNMFSTRYEHFRVGKQLDDDRNTNPTAFISKEKGELRHISKRNRPSSFHFVAFLPHEDYVWAVDGLKENPRKVCPISDGVWWANALTEIADRWGQHGIMNILGVVGNGLQAAQKALAQIAYSFTLFKHTYAYSKLCEANAELEEIPVDVDDQESLDRLGLSLRFVHSQGPSMSEEALRKARGHFHEGEDVHAWYSALCVEAAAKQSDYLNNDDGKAIERESREAYLEPWGPVVHRWVKKLVNTNPERFRTLVLQHQDRKS